MIELRSPHCCRLNGLDRFGQHLIALKAAGGETEDLDVTSESPARRVDVSRLLAGAAKTIAKCALLLARDRERSRRPHFRPMGRLQHHPGDNEWKIRFLTDGRRTRRPKCGAPTRSRSSFSTTPTSPRHLDRQGRAARGCDPRAATGGRAPMTSTFRPKRTGRTRFSSRSRSSAWSSGSAASRRSRSACRRRCSNGRRGRLANDSRLTVSFGQSQPGSVAAPERKVFRCAF